MSNVKHTNATLKGFGYPVFPDILDQLRLAIDEYGISNLAYFESVCKLIPEFVSVDRPLTSDGYHWFSGLYFNLGNGRIAILIPWQTDYHAPDENMDDRSPAIYTVGYVNIDQFVAQLIEVIKKFGEAEQKRIADYHKEVKAL